MVGKIIVEPNKNEMLLYSMLLTLNHFENHITNNQHPIKLKAEDFFSKYKKPFFDLKKKQYIHHSKPTGYVLTINDAPNFSDKEILNVCEIEEQRENKLGSTVLPYLKHFYKKGNFEEFYNDILPEYDLECKKLHEAIAKKNLNELLNNVWETEGKMNMIVIPMPLAYLSSGVGPSFNGDSYQIIGPPFNENSEILIAHEGSHPRAKIMLGSIRGIIAEKSYLLKNAIKNPAYHKTYYNWQICFEEHFIRAMQAQYINPIISNVSSEQTLKREFDRYGMIYIYDFAEEIKNAKENKKSLQDAALSILERLDKKY